MRRPRTLLRSAATLTGALALVVGLTAPPTAAAPPAGEGTPVTVMTRNVYLGGDITRPLRPAPPGVPAAVAVANQNWALRQVVEQTDFPTRAHLLAAEIKDTKPDLVGLQEVALWRSGPLQLPPPVDAQNRVVPDATTVDLDFQQLLLDALRATGERYVVVHSQVESDVEGPAFPGFDLASGRDFRLTMRDVLLKRASSQVQVEQSGGQQYAAVLPFTLSGLRYEFVRGYAWADVRLGAKRLRVITTHLESQLSTFAMLQAQELVATRVLPAGRPVVVLCDCNSDPLDTSTKPGEPIPGIQHRDPYLFLRQHLSDAWLDSGTADPGWTSGLSEGVRDTTAAGFDHRIDLVLTRAVGGGGMPADQPEVVGDELADRSSTGLWPSDHAGVVVRLRP